MRGIPPGIDTPILDGKISAMRATTMVSHATPRLQIVKFYRGSFDLFLSVLTLESLETESAGPFGHESIRRLWFRREPKSPST